SVTRVVLRNVYRSFSFWIDGVANGLGDNDDISHMLSVRAGGSISIPCFYDPRYKNHVKYLCKGAGWYGCTYEVKTNQPSTSGRFSISDDKKQRIFAVTINDLTAADTDYWCILSVSTGKTPSYYGLLHTVLLLIVVFSQGLPSLYVDKQEVTGFKGGSVTVSCRSTFSGRMKWCRLGSICVTESGSIDRTAVTISASIGNVVNVTMSDLRFESSGWYWCAKGNLQMPVHITNDVSAIKEKYLPQRCPCLL
uniref:Immunoglobulin domain-containing protein n=1 Tax=Myripristis murdjan TaxID=586833 RepID=A0A667ZIU5_9TELE